MTDKQKIQKNLNNFQKDFEKLLEKYPEISVIGDLNGDILAFYGDAWDLAQVGLSSSFREKN